MVSLRPPDEPSEWQNVVAYLQTLDSFPLAECVYLVRNADWKVLAEEVGSRLSKRGTYFLSTLAPIPSSLSAKSGPPDRLLDWLHRR
jgi:hypothetical protein